MFNQLISRIINDVQNSLRTVELKHDNTRTCGVGMPSGVRRHARII